MAIIPVPARFGFSKVNSFKLQRATNKLRSKFTAQAQTVKYPFAVWMLDATLVELDGLDAGRLRSFLVQLEGQANSFRLPVPGYNKPSTGYNPSGLEYANADYAARTKTIQVGIAGASIPVFNEGDYFTVNDELKMVTSPVASNAGSLANVSFQPGLRKPLVAATKLVLIKPTILMTAAEDDVADWAIGPPTRQTGRFEAVEAVEI